MGNARFSDGNAGAHYAANDLITAVAEVSFHRARFAAQTPTPPMDFDERIIEADIAAELLDLRKESPTSFFYDPDPDNYAPIQAFAKEQRANGATGIVYLSVRHTNGECVAIFIPRIVVNARTAGSVGLRWNGNSITDAYRKESLTTTRRLNPGSPKRVFGF